MSEYAEGVKRGIDYLKREQGGLGHYDHLINMLEAMPLTEKPIQTAECQHDWRPVFIPTQTGAIRHDCYKCGMSQPCVYESKPSSKSVSDKEIIERMARAMYERRRDDVRHRVIFREAVPVIREAYLLEAEAAYKIVTSIVRSDDRYKAMWEELKHVYSGTAHREVVQYMKALEESSHA